MAAPKGNEYYLIRSKDGREKKYKPTDLIIIANKYFQWCLDNPLKEAVIYQRTGELLQVPKMRPFTIEGLCNFAEITHQTFLNYGNDEEYFAVVTRIRGIIENQQFEGAASGFLNPNIIARKLGLSDKKEFSGSMTVEGFNYIQPEDEANDKAD